MRISILLIISICLILTANTNLCAQDRENVEQVDRICNSQRLSITKPVHFTENRGQWDERVLFKADGAGGLTWFIERDGFTVLQSIPDMDAEPLTDPASMGLPKAMRMQESIRYPNKAHALKFKFQSTLPHKAGNFLPEQTTPATAASVESFERLSWNNNYFLGNDESKWAPNCGNYQRLVLKDVWDGVDVQWWGVGKAVEFDFVVTPGADASQIRVECLGLTGDMETTADGGELLLPTSLGILRQALPEAYQIEEDASLQEVQAKFQAKGESSFGVILPEGYDATKPLVVDPLVYSTYLGGNDQDEPSSLSPDGAGGVIVAGKTYSERENDFPTTEGAYQRDFHGGIYDAFITRLSGDGSDLIYSTYLGGSRDDHLYALCPDSDGGVVVAGVTGSRDFPTTDGAFQRNHGGDNLDPFIARLSEDGSELIYGTYLGGSRGDGASALCPDGDGGVVVAGFTYSDDFPTTDGAYQSNYGDSYEAFITNLNAEGSALIYSTYLGGRTYDVANALCPDGDGGVVVAGMTRSDGRNDFPTTDGAYQRDFGGREDGFIARLNAEGSDLIYSTYLGGSHWDHAYALSPDGDGGVVVAGKTRSNDFPTTDDAYQSNYGQHNEAFIARLNAEGSDLIYSTYLGGDNSDQANALIPDGAGGVVVAGYTWSRDFPTTEDAYQRDFGGGWSHPFIARFNAEGSDLIYSTYLGGNSGSEEATALCPDGAHGVIVAGTTYSNDFPTTDGAFDESFNGIYDVFITDIDIGLTLPGMLFGHVYDFADDSPLSEAVVFASSGDTVVTDEDGYWYFDKIRSGVYDLTSTKAGYNDSTLTNLEIADEETLEVDFRLRHPVFAISPDEIIQTINLGESETIELSVTNGGNGQLSWSVAPRLIGEVGLDPWELRRSYNTSEEVNDTRLEGVIFEDNRYYVSGANISDNDSMNTIYVLDVEGNEINRFIQPGESRYGMRDLAWDRELIWGCADNMVIGFTTEGDSITAFEAPDNTLNAITWDQDKEMFWIARKTGRGIYCCDREGNSDVMLPRYDLRLYGLAYWLEDPDGYNLYILHSPDSESQVVHKMNTETGDTMFVATLELEEGDSPGGGFITNEYDPRCWVMVSIADNASDDRIDIWQVESNTSWMVLEPMLGEIETEESQDLTLSIFTEGLLVPDWEAELVFSHNAAGGETILPVTLTIRPDAVRDNSNPAIPDEFAITDIYPNPFNSITTITYSLPISSIVEIKLFDLTGREVVTIINDNMKQGIHSINLNANDLSSGLYFVRLEGSGFMATRKVILIR